MALPTSASTSWVSQRTGIRAMVLTSDPMAGLQIEWSSQNSTSSSKWLTRMYTPSAARQGAFTIEVPYSTQPWYVRAKTYKDGQTDSAYTTVTSLRPQLLTAALPNPGMEARRITQFGTLTTAQKKRLTILPPSFSQMGGAVGTTFRFTIVPQNAYFLGPTAANTTLNLWASVTLPPNVTITGAGAELYRGTTGSVASWQLVYNPSPSGAILTLANANGSTGGWSQTTGAVTTAHAVAGSSKLYLFNVVLTAKTTRSNARLGYGFVDYVMPALNRNY